MHIIETGVIGQADAGTTRACITFGTATVLGDGTLLATGRTGDNKDSDLEHIEVFRSHDNGHTWGKPETPFPEATVNGRSGTLKLCYLTVLGPSRLLAAAMWVDRTSHPGKPLFNAETEGCLPMAILLSESRDQGYSWTPWHNIPMPAEIGPPSLTNPVLRLADGTLLMSVETNKHYGDTSRWLQKAVFLRSEDDGQSWSLPMPVAEDTSGGIFNWDLRCGIGPDGRIATFAWTYDTAAEKYLNIRRRISEDQGQSWSETVDLGFADQAGPPAMLPDGSVVLAWVDRFGDQCIRAAIAPTVNAEFDPDSEVVIYTHTTSEKTKSQDIGDLLVGMEMWGFGLPFATYLPGGDVLVIYYAGDGRAMNLHYARLGR